MCCKVKRKGGSSVQCNSGFISPHQQSIPSFFHHKIYILARMYIRTVPLSCVKPVVNCIQQAAKGGSAFCERMAKV